MDKPRTFSVKVEYVITVGHQNLTETEVRGAIERRIHLEILKFQQESQISIGVVHSAVITEVLP